MGESLQGGQQYETLQTTINLNEEHRTALHDGFEREKNNRAWLAKFKASVRLVEELFEEAPALPGFSMYSDEKMNFTAADRYIAYSDKAIKDVHNGRVWAVCIYVDNDVLKQAFPKIEEEVFSHYSPYVMAVNPETGRMLVTAVHDEWKDYEGEAVEPEHYVYFVIDPTLAEQQVQAEIVPLREENTQLERLTAQLL